MMQYKSVVVTWDFVMATLQVGLPTSGRQPDAWIYDVHHHSDMSCRPLDTGRKDKPDGSKPIFGAGPGGACFGWDVLPERAGRECALG